MAFSWNMYYLWLQHFLKRTVGPLNLIFVEVILFYDVYIYYAALLENLIFFWKFGHVAMETGLPWLPWKPIIF